MVQEYKSNQEKPTFFVGENVDCKDEKNIWLNAEVLELTDTQAKVHYSGYHRKFDRWVELSSDCILKQWRVNQSFKINNRVDVLDTYNEWREARVVDKNSSQIKVHYKGFTERWDEWINSNSDRIAEIGSKSTAFGVGKSDPSRMHKFAKKDIQTEIKEFNYNETREDAFSRVLREKDWVVFPVEGDGNCMFRSVSHQVYGTTEHHELIRKYCTDYLDIERNYFADYVVGGMEEFDDYLSHKRHLGAWGDDLEIQALAEIYDRPFLIFAYSNTPMKTFHENFGEGEPIRISYHGQSHYNSIVNKDFHIPLLSTPPGVHELNAVTIAKDVKEGRAAPNENIARARANFNIAGQIDIDEALRISLEEYDKTIVESISNAETEEAMLKQAMEESQQHPGIMSEEEQLRLALEQSQQSPGIQEVLNSGFTLEQAVMAQSAVGNDPNAMIEFIFNFLLS